MSKTRIPIIRPDLGSEELRELKRVLASGIIAQGPTTKLFEEQVVRYTGAKYATATTSCTTALQLAVGALGLGLKDEVIVPSFTFPASSNAVATMGAKPVLVDVQLKTFNLDPASLEENITRNTRAIMPVHLFGQAADMDAIRKLAREHDLRIIEDAATGMGTRHKGRHVGALGDAGCFSFHPRKCVTTGEGGMLVTNSKKLYELAWSLKDHGKRVGKGAGGARIFTFERFGYNYRLSDLQAAVGLAQMRKLDYTIKRRRALAHRYDDLLGGCEGIITPGVAPYTSLHTYQSYVVLLPSRKERDNAITYLKSENIESTIGTYAVHLQPAYRKAYGYKRGDLPNAEAAYERSLTLPLYNSMTEAQQDRVAKSLLESLI